jgi:LmbE family N-acetylglucosaminyl deacetylase
MARSDTMAANATRTTRGPSGREGLKLRLRRRLHAVLRAALHLRSRRYAPPPGYDPVTLVIAPHEDDDVLGCGGLMARKRLEGLRVHVAYLTDGSGSHPGHPVLTPEQLAGLRQTEARAALRLLGVDSAEVTFLGVRDGMLDCLTPAQAGALCARLTELIGRVRPDEILLPCRRDGSTEHEAAFRLVQASLAGTGLAPRLLEYVVWAWWSPRLLARRLLTSRRVWRLDFSGYEQIKRAALLQHRSQLEPTPPWARPVLSPAFSSFFLRPVEYYFQS